MEIVYNKWEEERRAIKGSFSLRKVYSNLNYLDFKKDDEFYRKIDMLNKEDKGSQEKRDIQRKDYNSKMNISYLSRVLEEKKEKKFLRWIIENTKSF